MELINIYIKLRNFDPWFHVGEFRYTGNMDVRKYAAVMVKRYAEANEGIKAHGILKRLERVEVVNSGNDIIFEHIIRVMSKMEETK